MDTAEQEAQPICSDIHTNMSLKHNHLYDDFAHLVYIDDLLSQQPECLINRVSFLLQAWRGIAHKA